VPGKDFGKKLCGGVVFGAAKNKHNKAASGEEKLEHSK
jgi:hypothetical protein